MFSPYLDQRSCRYGIKNRHWSLRKNPSAIKTAVVIRSAFPTMGALLKSLIFAEVGNREAQGVHRDHVVRDPVLFHEHDVGDVLIAPGDLQARRGVLARCEV